MSETKGGFPASEMKALQLAHCSLSTVGTHFTEPNLHTWIFLYFEKPHCVLSLIKSKGHSMSGRGVIEKLILASVPVGRGQTAGL